jgi:hypothetical protein
MNNNKILVGLGLALLGFLWLGSSKKEVVNKELGNIELPEKFKNDVAKMSKNEITKAIEDNEKFLQNSKIEQGQRKSIEAMLEYLKSRA